MYKSFLTSHLKLPLYWCIAFWPHSKECSVHENHPCQLPFLISSVISLNCPSQPGQCFFMVSNQPLKDNSWTKITSNLCSLASSTEHLLTRKCHCEPLLFYCACGATHFSPHPFWTTTLKQISKSFLAISSQIFFIFKKVIHTGYIWVTPFAVQAFIFSSFNWSPCLSSHTLLFMPVALCYDPKFYFLIFIYPSEGSFKSSFPSLIPSVLTLHRISSSVSLLLACLFVFSSHFGSINTGIVISIPLSHVLH